MVITSTQSTNGMGNLATAPGPAGDELPLAGDGAAGGPAAVECRGLVKRFGNVEALAGLDLKVFPGKALALLGPSGCGKTTALRLIAGFDAPDAGTISIGGRQVSGPGNNVPPEKRRVGMVFQDGALFPHMTVEGNVAYGIPRASRRNGRLEEVLDLVGLGSLRRRMPHELSGGQQQRVALGRALGPRPDVLLLDEPFSNLDPRLREQVRRDVLEIIRASRTTTVFVTHDQEEALLVGDVVAVMNQGRVLQAGTPEVIFHRPVSRFVARFIGMVDFVPAWRSGDRLMTDVGSVEWPASLDDGSSDGQMAGAGDGDLTVMVRPDCLDCTPSEQGQGVIVQREFRGGFNVYRVALDSGHFVRCLLSHTAEYPAGARVTVFLRPGHVLRPFRGDRAFSV